VPAGDCAHRGGEIAAAIVDAVIETERLSAPASRRSMVASTVAPALRQLDRRDTDAAGAA
jgi:hypothetical protein